MINFFYIHALLWSMIICGYYLRWSDLYIEPIDGKLLCFLIVTIIISVLIGFFFRKDLKFKKIEKNPHKKSTLTKLFVLFFIIEFAYSKSIPLFEVLSGTTYGNVNFKYIPVLHMITNSFGIIYSFYLSYLYFSFKEKSLLFENLAVMSIYILCVTRQNILICVLIFINIGIASLFAEKKSLKKLIAIFSIAIIGGMALLYAFGIMGNMRYGDSYAWNDSSMICILGQINDNYPDFLPKEYFWGYTYLVSPLANLNYNVKNNIPINELDKLILQFVPDFISNKFINYNLYPKLMVSSLTVCTEYITPFLAYGMTGVIIFYMIKTLLCIFVLYFTYKNNKLYFMVVSQGLLYFYIFAFFDNTFKYSITSFIFIFCCILATGVKVKLK